MTPELQELVERSRRQVAIEPPSAFQRLAGWLFDYGDVTVKSDTGVFSILVQHGGRGYIVYGESPTGEVVIPPPGKQSDPDAVRHALSILRQAQVLQDLADV